MRVYDQIAAVVKSGGKTRRAAKMQSLKVWHPDVMEFIECKHKEERKHTALIEKGGYEANFNGEAYSSILFQNANLSVRLTDDFMDVLAKDGEWQTRWVTDETMKSGPYSIRASEVMSRMAECAWHCGDPGVQYDTTINRWHTCPNSGRINASNPCSEYMFLDNTACNLGQYQPNEVPQVKTVPLTWNDFDPPVDCSLSRKRFWWITRAIRRREIAMNSHKFRPLGLGLLEI